MRKVKEIEISPKKVKIRCNFLISIGLYMTIRHIINLEEIEVLLHTVLEQD